MCYENLTPELAEKAISDAIQKGCNIIFTTTPEFVQASVQAAYRQSECKDPELFSEHFPPLHPYLLCAYA